MLTIQTGKMTTISCAIHTNLRQAERKVRSVRQVGDVQDVVSRRGTTKTTERRGLILYSLSNICHICYTPCWLLVWYVLWLYCSEVPRESAKEVNGGKQTDHSVTNNQDGEW